MDRQSTSYGKFLNFYLMTELNDMVGKEMREKDIDSWRILATNLNEVEMIGLRYLF